MTAIRFRLLLTRKEKCLVLERGARRRMPVRAMLPHLLAFPLPSLLKLLPLLLLLPALLLLGCSADQQARPEAYWVVHGLVTDARTHLPVPGVTVSVAWASSDTLSWMEHGRTTSGGSYSEGGIGATPSRIRFTAPGYVTREMGMREAEREDHDRYKLDVTMEPKPTDAPLEVSAAITAAPPETTGYVFTIRVRNPNSVAKTWSCCDGCMFVAQVFTGRGLGWTPFRCTQMPTSRTFAPDEVYTRDLLWSGRVNVDGYDEPAPPGTYWAVAGLRGCRLGVDLGDSVQVVVR